MVLFKRKPVLPLPPPQIDDDSTEVWVLKETGEIFTDYEQYLARLDWYNQQRFICQITGHSGLTFFDALKSELAGAQEVEEAFPEALKGPVLRRVQFQTISRIDTLVDLIFEEFRADYYPGEAVTVHVVTGERLNGIVRDKTRFGEKVQPDGTVHQAFSRYFVSLDNRPTEEAVVDDAHITRDRKIFTKQVLRSFIKKTVTREAWTGAPWLVKHDVAMMYHIDVRIPPGLRYESKAAERKQKQAQQKSVPDYEGMTSNFPANGPRLPELKPATKSHKSKQQQQGQQLAKSKQQTFMPYQPPNPIPGSHPQYPPQVYPPLPYQSHTFQAAGQPQMGPGPYGQPPQFHNQSYQYQHLASHPPPPPPPPIKYPIEDLQVMPRHNAPQKPPLKFFSQDTPTGEVNKEGEANGISMKSVGLLLESWNTLNVYCQIFKLDSFTFDDFVEALLLSSEDVDCELLIEAHCAALKILVSSEADGGKIHIQLPDMDEDSDEEESGAEASAPPSPSPEPEPKPKGRATRSSLAKAEAEAIRVEPEPVKEPTPELKFSHKAAEMQVENGWVERLRKRDFKNGGWQCIIVGLLHQLSKRPNQFETCEVLLKELAPLNMDATPETARLQYAKLDINLRIQVLQLICILTAETKAIRAYMEECSEQMTVYRKKKIDWQRKRKACIEDLRLLNEDRKMQLPANMPPSPAHEATQAQEDISMLDVTAAGAHDSTEDDIMDTDDGPHQGRSLRRGTDRVVDRKRKRESEQEKREKAEAEAKLPKQSKEFTKLLKDIQKKQEEISGIEAEIATIDNDLREADCPRTRALGKDRYWCRYYWLERNGMPYGGLGTSSTADAKYANGRLWVQGPDDLEREGYIDLKPEWQAEYKEKHGITVPERKKIEEGETSVFNARQWGYIDEPEALDALIRWLDVRGYNEMKLAKELKLYRDRIANNMLNRKEYLNPTEEKAEEKIEPASKSSRKKSQRKKEPEFDTPTHRCLSWHNLTAIDEIGHLHYDEPRARKPAKKAAPPPSPPPVEEERQTRSEARGKKEKRSGR